VGKSTLLSLFSGSLQALSGYVERNKFLRIATYNQHVVDELPMHKSALALMMEQVGKGKKVKFGEI
jgi:ATPase subunit of ABC transporter with duplicated ATPase domains